MQYHQSVLAMTLGYVHREVDQATQDYYYGKRRTIESKCKIAGKKTLEHAESLALVRLAQRGLAGQLLFFSSSAR